MSIFQVMLQRFIQHSPVTVMARVTIERALGPEKVNALFKQHANLGYTRQILFSVLIDLMGLVVCKVHSSVSAAYHAMSDTLPASLSAVYAKLAHIEKEVTAAL